MREIWKKNKIWLIIAAYMLLLTAVFIFVVCPMVGKMSETRDIIQKKIIDNEINQSRIAKIPEMEGASQAFNARKNDMNVILDKNNEIDLIRKLETLAEITGNKINLEIADDQQKKAVAPKGKESEDIIKNLPSDKYILVQINLEGGYSELINFIHKLENFNYYVNIVSINASKDFSEEVGNNANPYAGDRASEKNLNFKEIIKSKIAAAVYLKK